MMCKGIADTRVATRESSKHLEQPGERHQEVGEEAQGRVDITLLGRPKSSFDQEMLSTATLRLWTSLTLNGVFIFVVDIS